MELDLFRILVQSHMLYVPEAQIFTDHTTIKDN